MTPVTENPYLAAHNTKMDKLRASADPLHRAVHTHNWKEKRLLAEQRAALVACLP